MLDQQKHQLIMGRILREIYTNVSLAPLLGFKGGTCAYLFYGLPRFSVDLDFDWLAEDKSIPSLIFEKIKALLKKYGEIKNDSLKLNTVFFLLSYGQADRNIKLEINIRTFLPNIKEYYEVKEYLGLSVLASKKDYLFASKLSALTSRKEIAMRDIYDIWYFAKNSWEINDDVIKIRTKKKIGDYLRDCISLIEKVKENRMLAGLGEVLSEKEKIWVKKNLKKETIFLLKNYQASKSRKFGNML